MPLALVKERSPVVQSHGDAPGKRSSTLDELQRVREEAAAAGLRFAGSVLPELAWQLFQQGDAVLVDVRTPEELSYVGRVPEAKHVAWATGTAQVRNPRFVRELESKIPKDAVVLFLCRSGKRSAAAAEAATKAGYRSAFNVLEGFEGDLNERQRRGEVGGWRRRGLPWVQD
jgi:rhodanese-related sulfurtransferase